MSNADESQNIKLSFDMYLKLPVLNCLIKCLRQIGVNLAYKMRIICYSSPIRAKEFAVRIFCLEKMWTKDVHLCTFQPLEIIGHTINLASTRNKDINYIRRRKNLGEMDVGSVNPCPGINLLIPTKSCA